MSQPFDVGGYMFTMKTNLGLLLITFSAATAWSGPNEPHACCAVAPAAGAATASNTLPGESLYHLEASWTNQRGEPVTLADFAGEPVVITMLFSHCAYACPRTLVDLKNVRAALPAAMRERVRFVIVSIDPARDTPERLRAWATEQQLDVNWTLLQGDADAVRELSVVLEIPFIPQVDGSFGHANRIVLLDHAGVVVTSIEGLGAAPQPIVDAVGRLSRDL